MNDRDQWRVFCPQLHVEGGVDRAAYRFEHIEQLLGDLRVEGYVNVPDVLPPAVVEPLQDCIHRLHSSGIPLAFAFVYDEFWLVWQRVSQFISTALGGDYRALPDFWAWCVPPEDQGADWGPHRDRVLLTLDPDN